MPMGPAPFGIVPFTAVKLAGYSVAGALFSKQYRNRMRPGREIPQTSAVVFGGARTLLGLAAGASYAGAWYLTGVEPTLVTWLSFLFPVRLLEWGAAIWWFYDRQQPERRLWITQTLVGTAWSYCLDVIALLAVWVTPGAVWVC